MSTPHAKSRYVPRDRVSFFEEQARNRRASWRLRATTAFALVVMGLPLSLVLTPLLYALVMIVAHLLDLMVRLPDSVWKFLESPIVPVMSTLGKLSNDLPREADPLLAVLGLLILLLPGILFLFALWLGLRILFRQAGVGGILLGLGVREPARGDIEEKQLQNLIEEMAIAAGVPPPQLRLLDTPIANAAAIGSSLEKSTIVVTRGLLEKLDRDQTQGVIAHLIASVGNGDLEIAWRMLLVFKTYGLLILLLNTPFGSESRKTIFQLIKLGFRRKSMDPREAEQVAALLTGTVGMQQADDFDKFHSKSDKEKSFFEKVGFLLLLPVIMANLSIRFTLFFSINIFLGPCMALLWRSRRYLADAEAVQLTRNPDGLAQALDRLQSFGGEVPGGEWASHLFIVGSKSGVPSKGSFGESTGSLLSFTPPTKRRLKRLIKMGSSVQVAKLRMGFWGKIIAGFLILLFSALILLVIYLMLMVTAMLIMLNLAIMTVAMAAIHGLFGLLR